MTKLRDRLDAKPALTFEPEVARAKSGYMPQLDSLRAFAVMAVMFQHFYGSKVGIDLPIGDWGVQLFFVLSGFLITGILLNCRENVALGLSTPQLQLRQFYIRRSLRIWPLFYTVVLGAALIGIRPLRENLLWHLTYTSNILVAIRGSWIGPASHLWSLAVEEQFYLVWPWLMLWLPTRYLRPAIVLAIVIAPLYKIVGYAAGVGPVALSVLMVSCLDALGLGALLAWYQKQKPAIFHDLVRDKRYNGFGLVALLCALLSCLLWQSHFFVQVAGSFAVTLFFTWLIHRAAIGFKGATGLLLCYNPLLYLGQISYGIYIFHKFMSVVVPRLFDTLKMSYPTEPVTQALLLIVINVGVASCSWYLFEKPINNLKHRFKYMSASRAALTERAGRPWH